ncbi:thioredoxin domain-containing protein [Thiomicrospira sp. ALE5]|uniref:thioredoxin domain-containing protein n=1 Tax=Thiomicrospira sp. ALE5 TaxID=748650 RepID=UPI001F2EDD4C|nr:DUF255 domain-containing protein [Thiomicrospira sp. ALE5]
MTWLSRLAAKLAFVVSLLWLPSPAVLALDSPLHSHPSAYIALHANDPINWQLWGPEAMQLAQEQQKPIFISSGYFACHWCHVMHEENYQDPLIAELLNQHFISVKIDRELLPDLDDYLLNRLRAATGSAGWPLHGILTPEGQLFSGFVYQPRDTLLQTLLHLNHWWREDADRIRTLSRPNTQANETLISRAQLESDIASQLLNIMDSFEGGINQTQKFPHSPLLLSTLKQQNLDHDTIDWIKTTLDQMQTEHLRDHIHQGFFRYTVDPNWQEPHFEKMLYDNAQLAELFFIAGAKFDRADFISTAIDTLNYVENELLSPITGLAQSSQSAIDERGIDGARYIWSRNQLIEQLDSHLFEIVNSAWQLDGVPPFELGWLPKPIDSTHWPDIQQALASRPAITDDKQLLSWNGLLIRSYLHGYLTTQNPHFKHQMISLAHRLNHLLSLAEPPRALNNTGQLVEKATLEDFAYVISAFEDMAHYLNDVYWADQATKLRILAKQQFFINDQWHTSTQALLPGQSRYFDLIDLATPSSTAIMRCAEPKIAISADFQPWQYASYLRYHCE